MLIFSTFGSGVIFDIGFLDELGWVTFVEEIAFGTDFCGRNESGLCTSLLTGRRARTEALEEK